MRLDSIKSFKTVTGNVSSPTNGVTPEEEAARQEELIDEYFSGPTAAEESPPLPSNSRPVNDYTYGDVQGDTAVHASQSSDVADWLTNFPPTFEEVIANNENAVNYLDLLRTRYEKAKEDLLTLKRTYEAEIAAGAPASRIEELNSYIKLIDAALGRCNAEIEKLDRQAAGMEAKYIEELRDLKDYDNNHWVGRPGANGSFYVKYDKEGNAIFYDPKTRRAIPNPMMDPDYSPKLLDNDGIQVITKEEATVTEQSSESDIYLKLTETALNRADWGDNIYQTPIDISIPEYIWVEKNGDGNGQDPYKTRFSNNTVESRMVMAKWSNDGGLHQEIPADRSRFMQVQVTGVSIRSEESGYTDGNGNPLFNTIIELLSGDINGADPIAGRIQIEGFETRSNLAAATPLSSGYYVAASSVGISINGEKRASPVQVDASQYNSTARHIVGNSVDQVASALGVSRPNDGANGDDAFDENLGAFADGPEYTYNGTNDIYVSYDDKAGNDSAQLSNATGVFVRGIRGDITGTRYNDLIMTDDVNSPNDYAKEHMPKNKKPIANDEAFYNNRVDMQNGNNVWIGGRGNNFVFGVTFAWVRESNRGDENYLTMQEVFPTNEGTEAENRSKNPRLFAHSYSGTTYLYNPEEQTPSDLEGETPEEVKANAEKTNYDDYFDLRGNIQAYRPEDSDLVQEANKAGPDLEGIQTAATEPMQKWLDALLRVKEPDEEMLEVSAEEIDGQKTILDDEMNSFFDTMFGEVEGFAEERKSVEEGEIGEIA